MAGMVVPFSTRKSIELDLQSLGVGEGDGVFIHASMSQTTLFEIGFGGAIFACAWIGVTHHLSWIAVGYVGHGIWDWLHHTAHIATRTAFWFPPACVAFDVVVAAYVVWLAI